MVRCLVYTLDAGSRGCWGPIFCHCFQERTEHYCWDLEVGSTIQLIVSGWEPAPLTLATMNSSKKLEARIFKLWILCREALRNTAMSFTRILLYRMDRLAGHSPAIRFHYLLMRHSFPVQRWQKAKTARSFIHASMYEALCLADTYKAAPCCSILSRKDINPKQVAALVTVICQKGEAWAGEVAWK